MPMDITLVCVPVGSPRSPVFASAAASLDATMRVRAGMVAVPAGATILCSPARAAREAAAAMAIAPRIEPVLAEQHMGAWAGRALAEIAAADPAAFAAWAVDPAGGAPGGESFADAVARVTPLLTRWESARGRIVALTHAMTIRALLAAAIDMPAGVAMRVDLAPFAIARLSFATGWRLRAIGDATAGTGRA